jgi:hypothetical protein
VYITSGEREEEAREEKGRKIEKNLTLILGTFSNRPRVFLAFFCVAKTNARERENN